MSELKPCPFCGKKPNPNWTDESYIECTNRKCSVYGYGMSTGDWNTRPIEDELRKRISELEADIEAMKKRLAYLESWRLEALADDSGSYDSLIPEGA